MPYRAFVSSTFDDLKEYRAHVIQRPAPSPTKPSRFPCTTPPYMMPDMITKPAACAGLTIAETLVKRLIQETETHAEHFYQLYPPE